MGAGGPRLRLWALLLLLGLCMAAGTVSVAPQGDGVTVDPSTGPSAASSALETVLNPSADAFLGAVLGLRSRGAGLFGCGPLTQAGAASIAAMQVLVDAINSEKPGNPIVAKGVTLGVRALDHCGRPRVAVSQLADLLPELGRDGHDPGLVRTVGILDGAGLTRMTDSEADAEVRHTLAEAMVPVAPLDGEHIVPPRQRAQALLAALRRLAWRRFVVLRGSDPYSEELWQALAQLADPEVCVQSVHALPSPTEAAVDAVTDAVAEAASSSVPVVVLLPRASLRSFLQALREAPAAPPLLLADLVAREDSPLLPDATVYSLSTSPEGVPPMQEAADSLGSALQVDLFLTAAQPVLLFALALRRSWRAKCPADSSGPCASWTSMSRPEFLNTYFAPLAAAIARGERLSEPGWDARWTDLLLPPQRLSVYRYLQERVHVAEVLSLRVNSSASAVVAVDKAFRPEEEVPGCGADCAHGCVPLLKHTRSGAARRIQDNHLLEAEEAEEGTEFQRLVDSPQNVYLTLLTNVRGAEGRDSSLDCPTLADESADGADVDLAGVRRVEAFRWAVQRVNQQFERDGLPLQLGALVADTCASDLRAMALSARISHQLRGTQPLRRILGGSGVGERVVAVINALPWHTSKIATDILTGSNITTISATQAIGRTNLSEPFHLQIDLPVSTVVDAVVQALQQLGWSYISVVHSDPSISVFLEAAAKAGICVGLEVSLPSDEEVVPRLLGARAGGARGVLVWADAQATRGLFKAVGRAIALGTLRREDIFWILASPQGDSRDVLQEFGNVLGGAVVFSPQRRGVAEFQHYLQHETRTGKREHSMMRLYHQRCDRQPCESGALVQAGDWAVVQSVLSVGAALSNLIRDQEDCPSHRLWLQGSSGSVCLNGSHVPLDEAVLRALLSSPAPRADGPVGAEFRFSPSGAGVIGVEVDNFRRRAGLRSRSLGDVHFQRVGTFSEGALSALDDLLAYRDSGDEVRVSSLTSQCGGTPASCFRCRLLRGKPNSALGDWIVMDPSKEDQQASKETAVYLLATLDIHEPSSNPLQCGQEVNPQGVEQLEAFLWAVDQVNNNHSGPRVGAIALDTCGSPVRTGKLLAEVLWEGETEKAVVAIVAGGPVSVTIPALDTAGALGLPVLAPSARGPPLDRKTHPPYPLQLAPGSRAIATRLIAHLRLRNLRQGKNVGVLYHQDAVDFEETFRQLEALARTVNVTLVSVPVPVTAQQTARQALLQVRGLHVLVLLLPSGAADLVLRTAAALEDEGLWTPGEVTWVSLGAEDAMLSHSKHTLGGLVLRTRAGSVPEFESHFRSLSLEGNHRNPWFPEFWSSVFHCRGRSCKSGPHRDLHAYQLKQSAESANMINSVLAEWHALRAVRREICPAEPCRAMSEVTRVRTRLLELTPRMVFVGAGLNSVSFSSSGENANAAVEVVKVQMSAHSNAAVLVPVPEPREADMDDKVDVDPHEEQTSSTSPSPSPPDGTTPVLDGDRYVVELQPESPRVLVLLAAHTASSPFQCGDSLSSEALCQLASAMFALHRVNANSSQESRMGLEALDTCGQPARAYSSVFSRLSSQRALPVAAMVLDQASMPTVQPLLDMQGIARIPAQRHKVVEASLEGLSRALLDVSEAVPEASGTLVLLHGSSSHARSLARQLESASLSRCTAPAPVQTSGSGSKGCLSAVLPLPSTSASSNSGPQYLLSTQPSGSVVILALDTLEDVRSVLLAAQAPSVPRLVFLTTPESRSTAATLRADGHSVLSVVADSSVAPDLHSLRGSSSLETAFQQWLDDRLEPEIPSNWMAAIRKAQCQLDPSTDVVFAVEDVANGLRWALNRTEALTANLSTVVAQYLFNSSESPQEVSTFRLWRGDEALGQWSPEGGLSLSTDPSLLALEEVSTSGRPAVFHNLQHAWAVSLGVIALLGILLTLLTAVFFLSAAAVSKTPMTGGSGTSVLGYMILLGLLLVHSAALSRVLAPGEVTCGLRRILPASAYAIVFASMFLKVLTTWQSSGVRPLVLMARALCLAAPQIVISAGWLAFVPPSVHLAPPAAPGELPVWQCYTMTGDGDAHLLLSLAYTCLLMVGTAVLALLCSSKGEEGSMLRQESRSILVASVMVGVLLAVWGMAVVAALMPPPQRDVLAASVHVLAATTLLSCLFLPKLRLYLRLRREARNTAAIAATRARSQPIYGISHFQPFGGKLNPAFDAPSMDISLGESASQTGSGSESGTEGGYKDPTQAVPSSLYSMDMFSSQDSSSHGVTDMVLPSPVVVAMTTGNGTGTVRGSSVLHGTLRGPGGTLRGPIGLGTGTLRGTGGTLRTMGGTLRGSHFLPGTNEFTAPHRSSSMLLLPGQQESISYM